MFNFLEMLYLNCTINVLYIVIKNRYVENDYK